MEEQKIIDGVVYQAVTPQTKIIDGVEYKPVAASSQIVQPSVAPKAEVVVEEPQQMTFNYSAALADFTFERVDLNNPQSILSYGDNIKDQITDILESTAQMSVNQEQAFISDEVLKTITSFDESLEAADREAAKQVGLFERFKKKILIGIGNKDAQKEEQMKTYAGRYQDYIDKINLVIENVEVLKQNALSDIDLRKTISEQMKPLIAQFEVMVEAAEEDRIAYDQQTQEIASQAQSDDDKYLVNYRSQVSDIFTKKIVELRKVLVLYKEQLQQYAQQQFTDMNIVMQADSYIRDQAPILKAQGSTQVFNKGQSDRIEQMTVLNEASNIAVENNARNNEQNVKASTDLMVNGGFKTETIAAVQQSITRANSILVNGKKQLAAKSKKDNEALKKINAELDQSQREIIALIEQASGAVAAIEENSSSKSFRTSLPKRRR